MIDHDLTSRGFIAPEAAIVCRKDATDQFYNHGSPGAPLVRCLNHRRASFCASFGPVNVAIMQYLRCYWQLAPSFGNLPLTVESNSSALTLSSRKASFRTY